MNWLRRVYVDCDFPPAPLLAVGSFLHHGYGQGVSKLMHIVLPEGMVDVRGGRAPRFLFSAAGQRIQCSRLPLEPPQFVGDCGFSHHIPHSQQHDQRLLYVGDVCVGFCFDEDHGQGVLFECCLRRVLLLEASTTCKDGMLPGSRWVFVNGFYVQVYVALVWGFITVWCLRGSAVLLLRGSRVVSQCMLVSVAIGGSVLEQVFSGRGWGIVLQTASAHSVQNVVCVGIHSISVRRVLIRPGNRSPEFLAWFARRIATFLVLPLLVLLLLLLGVDCIDLW